MHFRCSRLGQVSAPICNEARPAGPIFVGNALSGISVAVQPGWSDLSLIGQAYQCRCSLVGHDRGYVFGLYICRRPH